MNTGSPQILERLAWEGVVDGRTALVICVIVALAAGWSLWRERRAVGRGWAAAFWVLRVVAFGVALWMLAGPTQQRSRAHDDDPIDRHLRRWQREHGRRRSAGAR